MSIVNSATGRLDVKSLVSTGKAYRVLAVQNATPSSHRLPLPSLGLSVSERRMVLRLVDVLLVNLALLGTAKLFTDQIQSLADAGSYIKWFITLSAVWFGAAAFFDCYSLARAANTFSSMRNSALAAATAVAVYAAIPFFTMPLISRGPLFFQLGVTVVLVAVWRAVYARVFVQPWFQQRALVIGAGKAGRTLASALKSAPHDEANPYRGTGYQLVGFIDDDPARHGESVEGVTVLGDHSGLAQLGQLLHIDEIILAITHRQAISDDLLEELLRCREQGLRVVTMTTVYERLTGRVPIEHVGRDLEMVFPMSDNAGERAYRASKRAVDLIAAVFGLSLMLLLLPFIVVCNALTSPGPLFYKQRRVGQGGKIFEMYKFRSMRPDAEKGTGAVWARSNDDRITPAGRVVRKTRIDELPQFINVLKGEMSLIGPRPERPEFVNALSLIVPFYRARHAVKPGITGWAQIRYGYGNTSQHAHVKLEYDLYYVKHASPLLDMIIALQTLPVMALAKGT
jgi:exopolysaccharide biosynthesis polyprenyl glycosylphosphotransferase